MPYIDWLGKDDVVHHHKEIAYKTIDCQEVVGDADSENMIIKGDNLLALKSLLPYYANAVKMIYIDPPYNTGNTSWVYNDNMDSPLIKKWLDSTVNAEDLSRSDKWLCMMYPRLKLLRELLREDGVIFISIDDAEVANLKLLCDEIFGSENFVANFIWKSRQNKDNRNITGASIDHEYVVCYTKNNGFRILSGDERKLDQYKNPDNDPRGLWTSANMVGLLPEDQRPNCHYDLINPETNIDYGRPKMGWRYDKSTMQRLINEQRIIWPEKIDGRPRRKVFLEELNDNKPAFSSILEQKFYTKDGTQENVNIFGSKKFDFPKPSQLVKLFIEQATNKNDIILDSFAGSGTTAHAVIEQNKQDGGNRKFILIETLDYAKEITAERVKRVQQGYAFKGKDKTTLYEKKITTTQLLKAKIMEKIATEVETLIEKEKANYTKIEKTFKENLLKVVGVKEIESFKEGLGGGFKYCELGVEIFDEFGELNSELTFADISKHIYFVEFKHPLKVESEALAPNSTKLKLSFPNLYIGSHKKRHLYFFEERFKIANMKKIVREQEAYKEMIVYTRKCSISDDELKKNKITVRYIPYDIKDN